LFDIKRFTKKNYRLKKNLPTFFVSVGKLYFWSSTNLIASEIFEFEVQKVSRVKKNDFKLIRYKIRDSTNILFELVSLMEGIICVSKQTSIFAA